MQNMTDEKNTSIGAAGSLTKLARFIKLEHSIFSLPLVLAGAALGTGGLFPNFHTLLWIVTAAAGARVFGMSMNRILDRRMDAANPRTSGRELPSGRMTLQAAWSVALGGLALYLVSCFLLGPVVAALSPVPLVALSGYSLLKRFTPLCHFGIGLVLALAPLGAYVAASGGFAFGADILLLGAFTFCWMSGFDIIYGMQDIESDRSTGVHSIPAALGGKPAAIVAVAVHAVAFVAIVLLFVSGGGRPLAGLSLVVAASAFVYAHLPNVPLHRRFFPVSSIAGIAGALVPLLGT